MIRSVILIVAAMALCLEMRGEQVYFIGNSLTKDVGLAQISAWATSRGREFNAGRHIDLGQNLTYIYNTRSESPLAIPPYGPWPNALENYTWDALILQPFVESLSAAISVVGAFAAEIPNSTPKYIYQAWPHFRWGEYAAQWDHAYTPNQTNYVFSRDYFRQLMGNLGDGYQIIPAGEVLYEIDAAIKAGAVPGINAVTDLYYNDACTCHLNPTGYIAVNSTIYATLFKESPIGLTVAGANPEVVDLFQRIAWDVVSTHPSTGVSTPASYSAWKRSFKKGLSDAAGYAVWRNSIGEVSPQAVPESGTITLVAVAAFVGGLARKRFKLDRI